MPRYLSLLIAIALPFCGFSQSAKDIPVFGKLEKADLLQNTDEFDKNAEAVVLFDHGVFYFDIKMETSYQEMQHHVRIKILKTSGLDNANIRIRYLTYKTPQSIMGLSAITYNLNDSGNIVSTKLDKALVYTKKINSRYSEQTFTMPAVKPGSIIEYKYTLKDANMSDWYLQKSIPVRLSLYEVDFPSAFEIYLNPSCTFPYKKNEKSTGSRTIQTFSMSNVPALREENYITCQEDYLQKIQSQLIAVTIQGKRYPLGDSWGDIAEQLLEDDDFGTQLKKEIPRTADLDLELKNLKDAYSKMLTVYNYVRRNMKWDGKDNIWALDGVKTAWKEKSGTSGEINLILINLLRDAGVKAFPIMVSTRDNGRISMGNPDVYEFNKVLALVEMNAKTYVLDGTDKYTPINLIPQDIMYTDGLVIDASNDYRYRWKTLWDSSKMERNITICQASVDAKGMHGRAMISSQDYARTKRAPFISEGEKKYAERFYGSGTNGIKIDSLEIKNKEIDSLPLEQNFVFDLPVNSSGEYSYFSANLFSGFPNNPFISDERFSDVFFGTNQVYTIITNFRISDDYLVEELPKNIRMTLQDKSLVVTRMTSLSDNNLSTRITLEFKRPFYTAGEYVDLKEFYKKMYALLDEQFVIKKKGV